MRKFISNNFINILPIVIATILWITISFKACLLFYGLFNLGMYVHVTLTTLSNALVSRDINPKADVFWKIIFLTISTVCLTIFFVT